MMKIRNARKFHALHYSILLKRYFQYFYYHLKYFKTKKPNFFPSYAAYEELLVSSSYTYPLLLSQGGWPV